MEIDALRQYLAQLGSLLASIFWHGTLAFLSLPFLALRNAVLPVRKPEDSDSVRFYEGTVHHARKAPKENSFRYPVRTALISLDRPPVWFKAQAMDHLTADQARQFAGTDGPVKLLTNPMSLGYAMNPISVYYCYTKAGNVLERCIAEVTNTPWNERVTFVFTPEGEKEAIRKALHVSPLMDMAGTWRLQAPEPSSGKGLKVVVRVEHPTLGNCFYADLVATPVTGRSAGARNEEAGLRTLLRYGFQPHRIAFWIYWQAVVLLWKGVPLYAPPPFATLTEATKGAQHPTIASQQSSAASRPGAGCPFFAWNPSPHGWPWDSWGASPGALQVQVGQS